MDLPFHRKVEMSKQDQPKVREARNALHGRILRCPVEDDPPDCQFFTIRQLPLEKRLDWLAELSDETALALYDRHLSCFRDKTEP